MGWKDAPEVTAPAWQSAPENEAAPDLHAALSRAVDLPGGRRTLPDLGPLSAIRSQFAAGLTKGGFDEGIGGLFAQKELMPGAHLRMPDGSMRAIQGSGDQYRAGRDFLRQEQASASEHWPKLGFGANMGGELLSDYVIGGPKAAGRTYQTLAGLARGFLGSNADLTPGQATMGDAGSATLSTLLNGAIGNLAPAVVNRVAGSGAAKYVGKKLGGAAEYAGEGLKDLAGWLKVNSIHPTPGLGKKMADLPGGVSGVGKELLERGVGGFTKGGTAAQVETELKAAGGVMDGLANAYDKAGGAPINAGAALAAGRNAAAGLTKHPVTREAGDALTKMLDEYEQIFSGRNVTAAEALEVKRALGKAVYGARQELKQSGKKMMGDFGEGLAKFERGLDDQLDSALGPGFEKANTSFRRLLGANEATETQAARSAANLLLLGLGNSGGAGIGALLGGGPGAVAGLAGTALLSKYGSQAGARSLYGLGSMLQGAPGVAGALSQGLARGPLPQSAAATLRDLLAPRARPPMLPAYAMEGEQ